MNAKKSRGNEIPVGDQVEFEVILPRKSNREGLKMRMKKMVGCVQRAKRSGSVLYLEVETKYGLKTVDSRECRITAPAPFAVGSRVEYKAGGKVARLEGNSGKWLPGTVKECRFDTDSEEWDVIVAPDHRAKKGADFHGMLASCGVDGVRLLKPASATKTKLPTLDLIRAGYYAMGRGATKVKMDKVPTTTTVAGSGGMLTRTVEAKCYGSTGTHHALIRIKADGTCQVRCNCDDYKWTFARVNHAADAHLGRSPDLPPIKGTGKPRNPDKVVGCCKHIMALAERANLSHG